MIKSGSIFGVPTILVVLLNFNTAFSQKSFEPSFSKPVQQYHSPSPTQLREMAIIQNELDAIAIEKFNEYLMQAAQAYKNNEIDKCLYCLEMGQKTFPQHNEKMYHLVAGRCFESSGNRRKAKKNYKKAYGLGLFEAREDLQRIKSRRK